MLTSWLWEPLRAYWARKRLERLRWEAAAALFRESGGPQRVEEDPDADDWRPLAGKGADDPEHASARAKARHLADYNPYARSALTLFRNYVVGTGMRYEVVHRPLSTVHRSAQDATLEPSGPQTVDDGQRLTERVAALWEEFAEANEWDEGNRKDWEFCLRTWRDGECFLRLFRQPAWPPRIHFIDPEHVAPDPRTGCPSAGIETAPDNVERPVAYFIVADDAAVSGRRVAVERVEADRVLHTKIGVDGNVKRGVSIFLPVLDALKRFQGWLDVELVHRKLASSIVLVRKHHQNDPGGISAFADSVATGPAGPRAERRQRIEPGTILDVQGYDLELLAPNTHFDDAAVLGRMILLSVAAGTGLPEFMLSADASNANYASTLVAEGPAVRHFAAWQAFFAGQWRKLFRMLMGEAVRLGLLTAGEAGRVALQITPPPLAVRDRHREAQADALYYDRGALSARELARRDHADPDLMQRERRAERDANASDPPR